jgi:hypothetical protein
MKEKVLKLIERMPCVEKTSEKFDFSYLYKFFSFNNLDGMENLENAN